MPTIQKITPCLVFDDNVQEAVDFYQSVFKDGNIISSQNGPNGRPLVIHFTLAGNQFLAFNGGPAFHFTEAISLSVDCEDQAEVDDLWQKLTASGGSASQCGWLKDQFGVSWQIVPRRLIELLQDPERAPRVWEALMKMAKIDIATLENA